MESLNTNFQSEPPKTVNFITRAVSHVSILAQRLFAQAEGVQRLQGWDTLPFLAQNLQKIELGSLSPYQLARMFGFTKLIEEVKQELKDGHGSEYMGDQKSFEKDLGIHTQELLFIAVPPLRELLHADAGVKEGLSVGTHSMVVVYMFDKYLAHLFDKPLIKESGLTIDKFRVFLILHDIGKGLAVKEEGLIGTKKRKEKELSYSQQVFDLVAEATILSPKESALFKALLDNVAVGEYLIDKSNTPEALGIAVKKIKEAYHKFNLDVGLGTFFTLSKIFHRADAGSYKSLRVCHPLFLFGEKAIGQEQFRYLHMSYQQETKEKLDKLKKALLT